MNAAEAVMVGDRLDFDIIPARKLGMKTVWLKTGRQGHFVPRSPREVPDAEVTTMEEVGRAVRGLL